MKPSPTEQMLLLLLSSHDFALVVHGLQNRTLMDRAVGSEKVCSEKEAEEKRNSFPEAKVSDSERSGCFISQTAHGVQVVRLRFF